MLYVNTTPHTECILQTLFYNAAKKASHVGCGLEEAYLVKWSKILSYVAFYLHNHLNLVLLNISCAVFC